MKYKILITFSSFILILLFGLIAIKSLFNPGFYTSHDGEHQVIRLYHFDKALKDGQIPPRWAGTADNGYGYPLLNFTYQLPWFIGVPLLKLGFSLTDSIKGIFIIGYLLSGLFMFLWLKEKAGILGGILGGFLYLWAPYRFSNIYVRASLGEATVFMFLPLLFWGVEKGVKEKNYLWGIALTAIGLSGIILSHLMGLIIISIPLIFWIIINVNKCDNKIIAFKKIFIGILLGISISLYYLFPAILEKNYTVANETLTSQYKDHFVTFSQLIYSKWDYGFDFPGVVSDAMSFQVGIAQWFVMILVLIFLIYILLKYKIFKKYYIKPFTFNLLPFTFSFFVFSYSIFMMLPISDILWQQIIKYSYFDFPWRFLTLSVFIISMSAAYLVNYLKILKLPIIILIIIIAVYTNRNHLRVNQYIFIPDSYYEQNTDTSNQFAEYRPKTLDPNYIKIKRNVLEKNQDIVIKKLDSRSNSLLVTGEAKKNTVQKINIAYFPGWQVSVNNIKITNIQSSEGVIETKIPKGRFSLRAEFTDTPIRKISNIISLLSFLLIILLIAKNISQTHHSINLD